MIVQMRQRHRRVSEVGIAGDRTQSGARAVGRRRSRDAFGRVGRERHGRVRQLLRRLQPQRHVDEIVGDVLIELPWIRRVERRRVKPCTNCALKFGNGQLICGGAPFGVAPEMASITYVAFRSTCVLSGTSPSHESVLDCSSSPSSLEVSCRQSSSPSSCAEAWLIRAQINAAAKAIDHPVVLFPPL